MFKNYMMATEGSSDFKVKVKDLPLYDVQDAQAIPQEEVPVPFAQQKVGDFRRSTLEYTQPMRATMMNAVDKFNIGRAHTMGAIEYIQSDPAVLARVGVISIAALGGVIAGYRGGPIRKLLYGSFSGLTVSAVCYPKEATVIGNKGVVMTTDAATQAWESVYASIYPTKADALPRIFEKPKPVENTSDIKPEKTESPLEDHGQSNPKDKDLYTTR